MKPHLTHILKKSIILFFLSCFYVASLFANEGKIEKQCVGENNLRICLDGDCTTAPCMEGASCVEGKKDISHQVSCVLPTKKISLTTQCPAGTSSTVASFTCESIPQFGLK